MLEFRPECPSRLAEEVGARVQAGSPTLTLTWSGDVEPEKSAAFFRVQHWKRPATPIEAGRDQVGTGIMEKGPGSSRRKKSPVFFQFRVFFRMTREQGGARTQGVAGREDHRGARGGHFRLPEENGARVLAGNALLTPTP